MADLIERTRALILIGAEREVHAAYNTQHDTAVCAGISEAMRIIKAAPAVDAVPVVRCYQCLHSASIPARYSRHIDTGEMMSCRLCRGTEDATTHLSIVPLDGYCDEGEKRMDADAPERADPDGLEDRVAKHFGRGTILLGQDARERAGGSGE